MKRFHVHISVEDLEASIFFYSSLFAAAPTVRRADYAKWMLEDPRVNFAISNRSMQTDVDHLGIQVDSGEELKGLEDQLRSADAAIATEENTTCCYARSDRYWVIDAQGVAWEAFHTLGSAPVYGRAVAADLCRYGGARLLRTDRERARNAAPRAVKPPAAADQPADPAARRHG